jgi:hypothetical protein
MRPVLPGCRSVYGYLETKLRGVLTSRRGQAGVITAILAPVIIGAAALAIDAALWQVNQRSLQGAADQASIGGVNAYVLSGDTGAVATDPVAQQAALAIAASFGYPACAQTPTNGCPCTSGFGACAGLPVNPTSKTCKDNPTNCLSVSITQPQQRFLSQVVYSGNPVAQASAATTVAAGGACVLALDQVPAGGGPPPVKPPSISLGGSSEMDLKACNLVNNLNDPDATQNDTTITGSSILSATDGGKILLAQTNTFFGTGQVSPTPIYGTSPAPDPYANRKPPTITSCTYPGSSNVVPSVPPFDNTVTITSGTTFGTPVTVGGDTYKVVFTPPSPTTPVVFCGGLKMTSGNLYLNPGIYVMDGGGFTASGNSVIYGTGVTIYVTCDSFFENLTKNPLGSNISPKPDCSKNYGSMSITGTAGSCSSGVCDAIGYCESSSSCANSSDCASKDGKFCSHPDGAFYGDVVSGLTTIANLQQTPATLAVGNNISGLGIPTGATITAINTTLNTITISAAATETNVGNELLGPGFCSKACTGGASAPKVTLSAPEATTNPPTGTAGLSIWIDKNAPVGAATTFTGDAGLNINGAIYAPSQAVTYEGGQSSTSTCSQLVSLTINMSGGHHTTFSQAGCAANSGVAGHGTAQLVE